VGIGGGLTVELINYLNSLPIHVPLHWQCNSQCTNALFTPIMHQLNSKYTHHTGSYDTAVSKVHTTRKYSTLKM